MADRRTPRSDGGAGGAEDGAGPVLCRVIFVSGLAAVPTALADLDLVRGAARSVALALALAIILVGVGSLYRTRPPSPEGAAPSRAPSAPPRSSPPVPAVAPAVGAPPEAAEAPPGAVPGREAGP